MPQMPQKLKKHYNKAFFFGAESGESVGNLGHFILFLPDYSHNTNPDTLSNDIDLA